MKGTDVSVAARSPCHHTKPDTGDSRRKRIFSLRAPCSLRDIFQTNTSTSRYIMLHILNNEFLFLDDIFYHITNRNNSN